MFVVTSRIAYERWHRKRRTALARRFLDANVPALPRTATAHAGEFD
jgi:hypothetical protein